ncbi:MAG: response regulator, partial [Bacilli bacterium]|nr:response regulator [Bacilli bacterium]
MGNNSFTLLSLFYSIILIISFFSKKSVRNTETRLFKWIIISNFLNIIFALLFVFGVKNYLFGDIVNIILGKLILVCFYTFSFLFNIFVVSITKKKDYDILTKNSRIIYILYVIFLLPILLLPIEIFDENNIVYTYGLSCTYLYLFIAAMIIFWTFLLLFNIRTLKKKKCIPVIAYVILLAIVVTIQRINPELLLLTSLETIVSYILFNTIENPDVKMIEKLNIAKDQADKANRAKTDFLSSMSHEIRTPLNAIVGLSEDIASFKDEVPDQVKEDTDDIINASNTLLEIVGNILDISKIESDKLDIDAKPYNFVEEIEKLAKIDATRIGNKPIDFKVNMAPDIPYELIGDKVHVKEIVNNILTNAIKYTDKGKITLTAKCVNKGNDCLLIVSVEDTGRGIKKESINKLFTKFERLDERNSTIEGTGLGLAITKKLLDMMGGTINVNSTFGKGSLFIVQIPQKISKMSKPKDEEKNKNKEIRDNYKGMRILVVDDNELNIKVAARALSQLEFEIDQALSGQECIDKIKKGEKYDIILLDIMMPEMSGETTFLELKKID